MRESLEEQMMNMAKAAARLITGYDNEEFIKAMKWVKENCKEGPGDNPAEIQTSMARGNEPTGALKQ